MTHMGISDNGGYNQTEVEQVVSRRINLYLHVCVRVDKKCIKFSCVNDRERLWLVAYASGCCFYVFVALHTRAMEV